MNRKDKILKLIYESLEEYREDFIIRFGKFEVILLGTERTIHRDGIFSEFITPDIITLNEVILDDKNLLKIEFETETIKTTSSENIRVPYKIFFNLITRYKNINYKYEDTIRSANFFIYFGEVKEKISNEEYFELMKVVNKVRDKQKSILRTKFDKIKEERIIDDINKLDNL